MRRFRPLRATKDDIIETLLLNIFYSAEISTMLPVQPLFKGKITLIRPLVLLEEKSTERFANQLGLPYFPSRETWKRAKSTRGITGAC